jgi:predicted alpha/beta superfamily hydrolase
VLGAISKSAAAVFLTLTMLQGVSVGDQELGDIVIGKRFQFQSDILDEKRTIQIYLPDNYLDSEEAYPVLVVLDGERLFQYCVSIVDMMSPNHLPRMIIVGLPNTDRNRDLYPPDKEQAGAEAGTRRFLRFLREELIPDIEKQYRVLPYRVLMGHSLAGLFAVYTLIEEPDLFEGYIATSPSLRAPGRMEMLLDKLRVSASGGLSGKYLYMSGGAEEPEVMRSAIEKLDGAFETREGESLEHHLDIFHGEGHVPAKGFYQGLRRLFPAWLPKLDFFLNGSLDDLKQHYGKLSREYGFPVTPPPVIIGSVGQRMLEEEKWPIAVEVYEYYVSLYPRSVLGHLALAEAHSKADETDKAIGAVKRALELETDNERARRMLGELETGQQR